MGISEPPSPNRRGETYWSDDKPSICEDLHFINALFGKFCEKRPNLRQQWNKKGMSARRAGIPERVVKLANHWGGGPSDPTEWPAREPFLENAAGAGSEVAQERAARCHQWQSANLLTLRSSRVFQSRRKRNSEFHSHRNKKFGNSPTSLWGMDDQHGKAVFAERNAFFST